MKKYFSVGIAALSVFAFIQAAEARGGGHGGSHSVRGYTTKNGTYVQPHMQTNPNGTRSDNWSTKGNTNPYTGQPGTKPLNITPGYR